MRVKLCLWVFSLLVCFVLTKNHYTGLIFDYTFPGVPTNSKHIQVWVERDAGASSWFSADSQRLSLRCVVNNKEIEGQYYANLCSILETAGLYFYSDNIYETENTFYVTNHRITQTREEE